MASDLTVEFDFKSLKSNSTVSLPAMKNLIQKNILFI